MNAMPDHRPLRALADRRRLLTRGAVFSGLAAAAGLAPASAVAAQGDGNLLQAVLDRGTVRVGTGSTNPPWHFEDEAGQLVGFDVEMGRILARGLFDDPAKVEFVVQAADARIPNLQADRVDVVFQFMTVNASRAQLAEFSIPYYREAGALLFKQDSPYNSAAEITGNTARIAILQNAYAEELVHKGVPDAEVQQFDSVANSLLALDSGRVDATVVDLSTARWQAAQSPDRYKAGTDSWGPSSYSAAVKPGNQRWLNYVNTVLHEAMAGEQFDAYRVAFQTYFGQELPTPQAGFPFEYSNWAPGTGYGT